MFFFVTPVKMGMKRKGIKISECENQKERKEKKEKGKQEVIFQNVYCYSPSLP